MSVMVGVCVRASGCVCEREGGAKAVQLLRCAALASPVAP